MKRINKDTTNKRINAVKKLSLFLYMVTLSPLSVAHEGGHQLLVADHGIFMGIFLFSILFVSRYLIRIGNQSSSFISQRIKTNDDKKIK